MLSKICFSHCYSPSNCFKTWVGEKCLTVIYDLFYELCRAQMRFQKENNLTLIVITYMYVLITAINNKNQHLPYMKGEQGCINTSYVTSVNVLHHPCFSIRCAKINTLRGASVHTSAL